MVTISSGPEIATQMLATFTHHGYAIGQGSAISRIGHIGHHLRHLLVGGVRSPKFTTTENEHAPHEPVTLSDLLWGVSHSRSPIG